jgi:hypothetical protein
MWYIAMMVVLSPEQAHAFRRRWQLVEERQRAEQKLATIEDRLDELERLMSSIRDFGWDEALNDDAPVRARWASLREKLLPIAQPR